MKQCERCNEQTKALYATPNGWACESCYEKNGIDDAKSEARGRLAKIRKRPKYLI